MLVCSLCLEGLLLLFIVGSLSNLIAVVSLHSFDAMPRFELAPHIPSCLIMPLTPSQHTHSRIFVLTLREVEYLFLDCLFF